MILELVVRSAQTVHLSCIKISTISKQTKIITTWASSPRSTIECIPKWFLSYVWRKPCTYLALTLTVSPNWLKQDSTWPMSPRRSIRCVQNDFLRLWDVRRKPCTYLVSRLALCPNRTKPASTCASSPRSTIRCVQNDFRANGTFDANRASILHQD
jgi:hypothetical protein